MNKKLFLIMTTIVMAGALFLSAGAAEITVAFASSDGDAGNDLLAGSEAGTGVTDDVYISTGIASSTTGHGKQSWDDNDLAGLKDSTIVYNGETVDYREEFYFPDTADPAIQTSFTVGDIDYETDIALELANEANLSYYFLFDETVNITAVTTTNKLKIPFLGKIVKITGYTDENTMTAMIGDEFSMESGGSISLTDKNGDSFTITLNRASDSECVFGITYSSGAENEEVTLSENEDYSLSDVMSMRADTCIGASGPEASYATVVAGEYTSKTIDDADAYTQYCTSTPSVDCAETNPDWRWDIDGLNITGTKGDHTDNNGQSGGPTIGIVSDFALDDADDNWMVNTGTLCLPHDYVCMSLDGPTVEEDDYMRVTIEANKGKNVDGTAGSETVLYFHADEEEGIVLDEDSTMWNSKHATYFTDDVETDEIAILPLAGGNNVSVYYRDADSTWRLAATQSDLNAGGPGANNSRIGYFDYKDTTGVDQYIQLNLSMGEVSKIEVCVDTQETNLAGTTHDLCFEFYNGSTTTVTRLGMAATNAAADVTYGGCSGTGYGSKEKDMRTAYGTIIHDIDNNNANEKVVLDIPGDVVKQDVTLYGPGAVGYAAIADSGVSLSEAADIILGDCAVPGTSITAADLGLTACTPADLATYYDGTDGWKVVGLSDGTIMIAGYEAAQTKLAADWVIANGLPSGTGVLATS